VRTQQTAEALKLPFETNRKIGPEACVSELIAASGWPHANGAVLIVGHQPSLGRMAPCCWPARRPTGASRRARLWWLTNRVRRGDTQTVLRAMIPVELLD
jgi:phosphohistidine phosphatase